LTAAGPSAREGTFGRSSSTTSRWPASISRGAERQEDTRRRIVAAAVELHTTEGPARTTVKAIAEKAGVSRPTVYVHFPDERSLLEACSGHVRATVPPPDPTPWRTIPDARQRFGVALRELYAYYERLEPLLENVQRDAVVLPVVAEMNAYRVRYLAELRDLLVQAWPERRKRARLRQAVGHALEFATWQSLVRRHGCTAEEAARLMLTFVSAAASEP
jgi:AcrR family transcriptional regulator